MDVESLQKSGSRRLRCLDVFLVISVILLFLAVGVLTVGLLLGFKLQSETHSCSPTYSKAAPSAQTSDAYKMQNFAYLQITTKDLTNGTMTWAAINRGIGTSVGSLFDFHAQHHTMKTTREGYYFIYVNLQLRCTSSQCDAGNFTVRVGDDMTCDFELPQWKESAPVLRRCWQVVHVDAEKRFVSVMAVPKPLVAWTIDVAASGQGIYLMD